CDRHISGAIRATPPQPSCWRLEAGVNLMRALAGRPPGKCEPRPQMERLESRCLCTVTPASDLNDSAWLSHSSTCPCPICSGLGLDALPAVESGGGEPAAANPLSSLPALHSNPGAAAKLFL